MKFICKTTLLIGVLLSIANVHAQTVIETPTGGWRAPVDTRTGFVQEVNYPASSVNSEGKGAPALIRGRISRDLASTPKKVSVAVARPATLVVNGVSMPLSTEANGTFSRPYAFGSGSNSIQIRTNNSPSKSVQFYDTGRVNGASRTVPGIRVVLSWTSNNTDLDLHVITPSGGHSYYGNRVLEDGSALDVDVTTGYGPEIWAAPAPKKGVYHVYVNYFGAGDISDAVTVAEVAIITKEGSLHEKRQVFRVPLRKPGELMLIKSFIY